MSLLEKLNAARGKLKSVETRVLRADGSEISEKRNSDGSFIVDPGKITNSFISNRRRKKVERLQRLGYVVDLKPDLQLAECAPGVFLGSQDVAADLNILKEGGVTHVINCATGIRNFFPKHFVYFNIELLDVPESDIKSHLFSVTEYINEIVTGGGKVFVHCNAGISRSSTFVIAYVMKYSNLSLLKAMEQVKTARPIIRPNAGFLKQLEEYESSLLSIE